MSDSSPAWLIATIIGSVGIYLLLYRLANSLEEIAAKKKAKSEQQPAAAAVAEKTGAVDLDELAPLVWISANRRFYCVLLTSLRDALHERGLKLERCPSSDALPLNSQDRLVLACALTKTRYKYLRPLLVDDALDHSVNNAIEEGAAAEWLNTLLEGLAEEGVYISISNHTKYAERDRSNLPYSFGDDALSNSQSPHLIDVPDDNALEEWFAEIDLLIQKDSGADNISDSAGSVADGLSDGVNDHEVEDENVAQPEKHISGGRVISEAPEDGATAVSFLKEGYTGPCAMKYEGNSGTYWAIFPSVAAGSTAACLANRHDIGGFRDVELHLPEVAPAGATEFESAEAWLIE
ncbi:hypothetical protein J7369_22140 [Xanthomonas phaseoli pv. dieffenbachiae]|uniref:hypothetical protein n=1 Tax=Xanthomonas phaseoli TaxID=1985254 RepID=UPI001ADCEE02|nr:hypothetical protein [Xanthomonas phaseoli]MBO9900323.1 hypothetical protein [Xanthomonas phaseoli pv. dieffenbachiae]